MGGRTHGKTTKIVLTEIKQVHGNKFLYDKFEYVNSNTKVTLGCLEHGYFEKWPNDVKNGSGCPKCSGNSKKTNNEFIEEVSNLYSHIKVLEKYKNALTSILFKCLKHNYIFSMRPNGLLSKHINCPECIAEKSLNSKLLNSKSVIDPKYKTEFELYKQSVWRFSNRTYKQFMVEQKRDRQNHLDHILSIVDGYKNNIPPEIMGSIHNLRVITGHANRVKSYKSDLTVEELLKRYNK